MSQNTDECRSERLQFPLIIAAAGRSRRYGRPKLLEIVPGSSLTLIEHVVGECSRGGAGPIVVVLGPDSEPHSAKIAAAVRELGAIHRHVNPAPCEMRASVEQGIDMLESLIRQDVLSVPRHLSFAPADLPGLRSAYVAALIETCRTQSETLIRGTTPEGRGIHPAAIAWKGRNLLRTLPPECGLNRLWANPETSRHDFVFGDDSDRHDLDNPQDWQKFSRLSDRIGE